jgi:hypothetical protein
MNNKLDKYFTDKEKKLLSSHYDVFAKCLPCTFFQMVEKKAKGVKDEYNRK